MVAICNSYLCKLCIVFDLNKNLTLKKDNSFSFSSLNRFFALSFDKIGCISTIKIKVFWTFILYCPRFTLSLQSVFGRSVDRCPFCGKIIKRLLIIRMFEKLGGGKDIVIENNGERSRYAWTLRYISLQ